MKKIIHVNAETIPLSDVVLRAKTGDALLTGVLAYMVGASRFNKNVDLGKMAAHFGSSLFSAQRWIRRLSDKGILRLNDGGEESWVCNVKLHRMVPQTNNEFEVKLFAKLHDDSLSNRERSREVYRALRESKQVGAKMDEKQMLSLIPYLVNEPTFSQLRLGPEIMNADGWLVRTHTVRRNMRRFLGSWMKRALSFGARNTGNANKAPSSSKYRHLSGS